MVKGRRSTRKPVDDNLDGIDQCPPVHGRQPHHDTAHCQADQEADEGQRSSQLSRKPSVPGPRPVGGKEQHKKPHKEQQKKCYACGKRGHTQDECHASRGAAHTSAKLRGRADRGRKAKAGDASSGPGSVPAEELSQPCSFSFVDAHCTLHGCFARARHFGTAAAFFEACCLQGSCEGVVAVFADSACFAKASPQYRCWEAILTDERVWAAFGCRPREAQELRETIETRLEEWLSACGSKSVALVGGLDYRGSEPGEGDNQAAQRAVLRHILGLARRLALPVMLTIAGGAEHDIAEALLEAALPAETQRIHVVDYAGDFDFLVLRLMPAWPRMVVGFDGRLTFAKAEHLRGLLFDVPLERLLLQSQAPDFAPANLPGKAAERQAFSHSGMVPTIAAKVAELKGAELEDIMAAARENVRAIYGI